MSMRWLLGCIAAANAGCMFAVATHQQSTPYVVFFVAGGIGWMVTAIGYVRRKES